jgi:hypothetical protein
VAVAEPQNPTYLQYARAMNDAQEAFVVAVKDKNSGNIDAAVKNLEAAPTIDSTSNHLLQTLKILLLQAKKFGDSEAGSPPDKTTAIQQNQLMEDFSRWRNDYNQWLKTAGRNYSGLNELVNEPQK